MVPKASEAEVLYEEQSSADWFVHVGTRLSASAKRSVSLTLETFGFVTSKITLLLFVFKK